MSNPNKEIRDAISLLLKSTDALTLHDKMSIHAIYELSKQTECISPIEEPSPLSVVNEFIGRTFTITLNHDDRITHKSLRENMSGPRWIDYDLLKKTLLKLGCITGNSNGRYSGRYFAGLVIKNT